MNYGDNEQHPVCSREKHHYGSIGKHSAERLQPTQEL